MIASASTHIPSARGRIKKPAPRSRMLERGHHQSLDEPVELDLAGHRLRHLHDGRQVELLHWRADLSRSGPRCGYVRIEVPHFPVRTPAHIARPRISQQRIANGHKPAPRHRSEPQAPARGLRSARSRFRAPNEWPRRRDAPPPGMRPSMRASSAPTSASQLRKFSRTILSPRKSNARWYTGDLARVPASCVRERGEQGEDGVLHRRERDFRHGFGLFHRRKRRKQGHPRGSGSAPSSSSTSRRRGASGSRSRASCSKRLSSKSSSLKVAKLGVSPRNIRMNLALQREQVDRIGELHLAHECKAALRLGLHLIERVAAQEPAHHLAAPCKRRPGEIAGSPAPPHRRARRSA